MAVGSIFGYRAGSKVIPGHFVVERVKVEPVDAAVPASQIAFQHVVVALPPLITTGGFIVLKPAVPVVETYTQRSAELQP